MPNYCENKLKVTGDSEKEIEEFIEFAKGKNTDLTLNNFIPFPEELMQIRVGYCKIDGQEVHQWKEIGGKKSILSVKEKRELIQKCGAIDGLKWCVNNWGTKWDVMYANMSRGKGNTILYEFETAWSPPLPAVYTISKKFPKLKFLLKYREDGMGFKGKFEVKNGEVITDERGSIY